MKHIFLLIFITIPVLYVPFAHCMYKYSVQKTIQNIHHIQKRSIIELSLTPEHLQALHFFFISVNSSGLFINKAPGSFPAHCTGIAVGSTLSTPETLLATTVLTSFAFINNYKHTKNHSSKK